MGAPKQKWTPEEEAALRAGVDKYGPGKWRAIQKDPELGPCLASRSNVDLKDKWRNMNVGSGGHGSREKSLKALTKKTADEPIAAVPLSSLPGDHSMNEAHGRTDALVSSDSSKDRKSLGPRYDNLVLEAVLGLKDPNGSSSSAIATYIEEHHPVPSNFRRLLSSKLKDLAMQGKLIKTRQNYKMSDSEYAPTRLEMPLQVESDDNKQTPKASKDTGKKMRGVVKGNDVEPLDEKLVQENDDVKLSSRQKKDPMKKPRGERFPKNARVDVDFARSKLKTAEEASRAAALAVAEAEAAAAAAEQAAKEAEAAEAEAEAAEIAAEIAALAAHPPKKIQPVAFAVEGVAVTV